MREVKIFVSENRVEQMKRFRRDEILMALQENVTVTLNELIQSAMSALERTILDEKLFPSTSCCHPLLITFQNVKIRSRWNEALKRRRHATTAYWVKHNFSSAKYQQKNSLEILSKPKSGLKSAKGKLWIKSMLLRHSVFLSILSLLFTALITSSQYFRLSQCMRCCSANWSCWKSSPLSIGWISHKSQMRFNILSLSPFHFPWCVSSFGENTKHSW